MAATMADIVVEKSTEDLHREIDELRRQQREITERLRDPRGLRKGAIPGSAIHGVSVGTRLPGRAVVHRGVVRRGDSIEGEDLPPTKKRLLSAVVKVEGDGEDSELGRTETYEVQHEKDREKSERQEEEKNPHLQRGYRSGRRELRVGDKGLAEQEIDFIEPLPRVIPKVDDPNVTKRNRRMFGALLGTLEKFRQEDKKLSGSEAFLRRSTSQKRAEQRAREESERLRQQERELLAGKRRRDLILRARLAAKADEKQMEVLFIQWAEHNAKLCSFLRTKTEPGIFYMPARSSEETDKLLQMRKGDLAEWRVQRRAELSEYQRQSTEDHLARVEVDIERWQAVPQHGSGNDTQNNTAEDSENTDGTADKLRVNGKHMWNRSRMSKVSDNVTAEETRSAVTTAAEKQEEGTDEKAKEIETEVKIGSVEREMKGRDAGESMDTKDGGSSNEEYDSGTGEMEER